MTASDRNSGPETRNGPERQIAPGAGSGRTSVAVVGGGLAGLAAAVALCERGFRVELFEAGRRLGGRAGSFRDGISGELVDSCQHVAMGCCTNLADFLRRTGTSGCFRRRRQLHFVGPDGRHYRVAAAPGLPAPLHLVPGLMQFGYLGLIDRLRIVRTLGRLARLPPEGGPTDSAAVGPWLSRQGESDRALRRFWSVVLVSALGETLDRASLAAARKVFVDGFLASRRAYELEVPRVPLAEIFDRRVGDWLCARGVTIHRGMRVAKIDGDADRARAVVLGDGSRRPFDGFVAAVPWRAVGALFAPAMLPALPSLAHVERIEPAPITAVHLWLDRAIPSPPEAALVGRTSQWVFRRGGPKAKADRRPQTPQSGHYVQVVISASHELIGRPHGELARQVKAELAGIWPAARRARLLRWRVITHREAVFSVRAGIEQSRPPQQTPIANLVLAGDWTATGWPATMEGAVRSGYLAAEAILGHRDPANRERLLAPDLPRARLARWIMGGKTER
ncbi:MAG TPA: hydroxysqualene dehydroxylase HpnE [Thermoguttaceae bacterium]|nr:hydroxysqualene dehydroxylase HpnE [Thermoguttaceae bacterium]